MKKLLSIIFISVLISSCGSSRDVSESDMDYKGKEEKKQAKEDSDKETNYLPIILIAAAVAGLFAYKKYVKKEE